MTPSIATFYDPARHTRPFGYRSPSYARLGAHPGLDLGQVGSIPALKAGRVTAVQWVLEMGMCVEVLSDDGIYLAYCHLANFNLPRVGAWLSAGNRVGQVATGSNQYSQRNHWNFRGTLSSGPHLHLVATRIARGAWNFPPGRRLSDYIDPAPIIRGILAAPAGGKGEPTTPAQPEQENFTMATGNIVTDKGDNHKPLADKDRRCAFVDTESGFACDFSWLTLGDADRWAKQLGLPGALRFSDAGFNKYLSRLAEVRK